jgi:lipopolysaccharide heptosyltransferase II
MDLLTMFMLSKNKMISDQNMLYRSKKQLTSRVYVVVRKSFFCLIKSLDFLCKRPIKRKKRNFASSDKIIVSGIGHIGDTIFSTPVYGIIKDNFPNSEIWALVDSCGKELLEDNPYISRIITYDHFRLARGHGGILKKILKNVSEAIKIVRIFRKNKFDLGIDIRHFFPMTILLMYFGGIKYIAGFGNRGFSFVLDKQFDLAPDLHEVEYKVQAIKQLGLKVPSENEITLELYFDDNTILKVRTLLSSVSVDFNKPIAVIHPGTGQPSRLWSEKKWAKVANFLIEQDIQVILAGGKNEDNTICGILNIIGNSSNCWDMSAKLSLKEFAALTKIADFVIGLESASSHIAAAVGTPIVSIYSGTTKTSQWRPWGKKVFVVKKDMSCAPCHNFVGCQNMFCLRDIEAYDIIDVIRKKIIPDLSNQRDMM